MKRKLTALTAILLLAAVSCALCGCTPGDAASAFKKMDKAGFSVVLVSSNMADDFLDVSEDQTKIHDIDSMLIVGDFMSDDMQLVAVYFKDKDAAKDAYDFLSADSGEDAVVRIKNNCVYFIHDNGGRAALNAFERA